MSRPTDWDVLDLPEDPTPGDPYTSRDVARTWNQVADAAERAETGTRSLLGDQSVLEWIGKAGDTFREHGSKLPDQLGKAKDSYRLAADAMTWWASQLETCQADADRALAQGRQARSDLNAANSALTNAKTTASTANATNTALTTPPPDGSSAPPPDPAKVAAAGAAATRANAAVTSAQTAVGTAQSALDAAKRLAKDAAGTRDGAGHTTSGKLHDASDAGIHNDSWWHHFTSALADAWHVLVQIAKVVVAVLSIVCLIIGGPLAWVLLAAALIVLADTAIKYAQGKASLWDVALAALSCIPMTKGLTSIGELAGAAKGLRSGEAAVADGRAALATGKTTVESLGTATTATEEATLYTAQRSAELQNALPEATRGRVTMASGVGRDEAGTLRNVIGSSEKNGYLRKPVRVLIRSNEEVAQGPGHAEVSILNHMRENGITPIVVGAGRPVCPTCAKAISDAGAIPSTPLKVVRPPRPAPGGQP